ncbi:MAG: hypothetical protein ABJO67_05855 [Pseudoruegeria sp.]
MRIQSIELLHISEPDSKGSIRGQVVVDLMGPNSTSEQTIHLEARVTAVPQQNSEALEHNLREDALRQLRRMPEFRHPQRREPLIYGRCQKAA